MLSDRTYISGACRSRSLTIGHSNCTRTIKCAVSKYSLQVHIVRQHTECSAHTKVINKELQYHTSRVQTDGHSSGDPLGMTHCLRGEGPKQGDTQTDMVDTI